MFVPGLKLRLCLVMTEYNCSYARDLYIGGILDTIIRHSSCNYQLGLLIALLQDVFNLIIRLVTINFCGGNNCLLYCLQLHKLLCLYALL